ncbi:hypothetical protein NE237_000560 [Protea cynaroides]|uniref:TF-B3 domain-containing protein n=1 Tax=Protea cynaroides TaxID=273540 RepID=A0A9Q0KRT4_9MAGN|nr:hypothetical protein NE237_000560 [Protea cynaroides]
MDTTAVSLTTISTTTTTELTGSTHETGSNPELGCSKSQEKGTQFFPFEFPSDYIDSSMLGPSVGGYYGSFQGNESMVGTEVGTSYRSEWFRPSSKSKAHQRLIRWPSSVTKAARSKRMIARRMGSSVSASSLCPSLSMSFRTRLSNEQASPANNDEGENIRTIRISDNKKDAEAHFPNLTVKEGIQIAVRDVSSDSVWSMRYRFWPNNTSRMYVLENTGDFVKQNGLEAGDYVMLYEDENKGLFIRGKNNERKQVTLKPGFQLSRPLHYSSLLQQKPHYYIPQPQSREGGSSAVEDTLSSVVAIDTFSTAYQQTEARMEEPSLCEGHQEVMGTYNSLFTDFDDSDFGELEMIPNFGSFYNFLMKNDIDIDKADKGDIAPPAI